MSDLSVGGGGLPPNWGSPSPVYVDGSYQHGGTLWLGKQAAAPADIAALKAMHPGATIDDGTLVGTYTWNWLSFADRTIYMQGGKPNRMGGIGSHVYEYQHVGGGEGVTFRKDSEGDMWYTNANGELIYGIPPHNAGAYYKKYVGDGYYDNTEGVEQGSPADVILGRGEFYWDDSRKLYDVR